MANMASVWILAATFALVVHQGTAYSLGQRNGKRPVAEHSHNEEESIKAIGENTVHDAAEFLDNVEEKKKGVVLENIEELIDMLESDKLGVKNIHRNRVKRQGWWWPCPWCGGTKIIDFMEKVMKCKCTTETRTTCTCKDGQVIEL